MLQRLQIEWMKIKPYRTFWVLFLLYLVSIISANYIGYQIQESIYAERQARGMAEMVIGIPPYAFPKVWHMVAYVSSYLLVLPGLLMIISVSNEFNFKTHRQNIIDGWSRRQFITVKLVMALIMAATSTIIVFITALLFGLANREAFSAEGMIFIFYYFIQALSYILTALLISLVFRRGGLAIGLFFIYIYIVDNVIAALLNKYANLVGRYLPLESTDNLVPFPIFENVKNQIIRPYNTTALFTFALAYLAIYIFLIFKKFDTDDL